jgi:hypothetical protein
LRTNWTSDLFGPFGHPEVCRRRRRHHRDRAEQCAAIDIHGLNLLSPRR